MARVTIAEVKLIIDTSLEDTNVTAYITAANALVTDVLASSGLGDVLLKEIERWLTAHLIAATQERQSKKEEAGGAKVEYTGVYGDGLKLTSYGQMVLTLDSSGLMASLGGRSATVFAIPSFE